MANINVCQGMNYYLVDKTNGKTWIPGYVFYNGHSFEVETCMDHTENFFVNDHISIETKYGHPKLHLVRTVKEYHNVEFEELFNFGPHCKGYYPGRMVAFNITSEEY